jgi:Zn-dependent protease
MIPVFLFSLSVHESAHAIASNALGDPTAKNLGRITLNPVKHFDLYGFLAMLFFGFGWAKPVPVMTRNFKKPRRDFAITSLAGPFTNFIVGFFATVLYVLVVYIAVTNEIENMTVTAILSVFYYSAMFNFGLGLFNLIPLPPLDGSNVVMCLLPNRLAAKYSKVRYYSRYIFLGLIILENIPKLEVIPQIIFWPLSVGREFLFGISFDFADWIFSSVFFG